jgi:hypothetical protein
MLGAPGDMCICNMLLSVTFSICRKTSSDYVDVRDFDTKNTTYLDRHCGWRRDSCYKHTAAVGRIRVLYLTVVTT